MKEREKERQREKERKKKRKRKKGRERDEMRRNALSFTGAMFTPAMLLSLSLCV
ncbi:MAG TPA: hypothetical protein V6C97_12645 [Oculatellaceae cyanobacterium]